MYQAQIPSRRSRYVVKRHVTGGAIVGQHLLQLEALVRKTGPYMHKEGSGVGETTRTGIAGAYCSSGGGGPESNGIHWVIPGPGGVG